MVVFDETGSIKCYRLLTTTPTVDTIATEYYWLTHRITLAPFAAVEFKRKLGLKRCLQVMLILVEYNHNGEQLGGVGFQTATAQK